ncbi:MAG: nucleotidyltransferase [Betaproteobacteria bacterium]|nr:nucleotidyltransferase [Betaproteobacteria bacterium]MCL2886262.1 nucleotidyltransferase [Betaproteobacteria bacterium]
MIYLDLFRALQDHGVRYLLVGGLAVNLHGIPRMTMDIDLVLAMDDENLDCFLRCAQALNLTPSAPVAITALKDPAQRRFWVEHKHMIAFGLHSEAPREPLMIDILIAPPLDIEAAIQRAQTREIDGVPILLSDIGDLIALKLGTGRLQDESDIRLLEQIRDQ